MRPQSGDGSIRAVLLLLVFVVAAAACGDRAPQPTTADVPQPSTAGSGPIACTAADVEAIASQWGGATGQVVGAVVFRNSTDRPCELVGFPRLELGDAEGLTLVAPTEPFNVAPAEPVVLTPRSEPIALVSDASPAAADGARPGQAIVRFLFGNLCTPLPAPIASIVLTLPGDGTKLFLRTRLPSPPRCDVPGRPPSLAVGPFEPPSE
jgi:uncharacterized protein DUF4232